MKSTARPCTSSCEPRLSSASLAACTHPTGRLYSRLGIRTPSPSFRLKRGGDQVANFFAVPCRTPCYFRNPLQSPILSTGLPNPRRPLLFACAAGAFGERASELVGGGPETLAEADPSSRSLPSRHTWRRRCLDAIIHGESVQARLCTIADKTFVGRCTTPALPAVFLPLRAPALSQCLRRTQAVIEPCSHFDSSAVLRAAHPPSEALHSAIPGTRAMAHFRNISQRKQSKSPSVCTSGKDAQKRGAPDRTADAGHPSALRQGARLVRVPALVRLRPIALSIGHGYAQCRLAKSYFSSRCRRRVCQRERARVGPGCWARGLRSDRRWNGGWRTRGRDA